jgi:hypothetical protein
MQHIWFVRLTCASATLILHPPSVVSCQPASAHVSHVTHAANQIYCPGSFICLCMCKLSRAGEPNVPSWYEIAWAGKWLKSYFCLLSRLRVCANLEKNHRSLNHCSDHQVREESLIPKSLYRLCSPVSPTVTIAFDLHVACAVWVH